jgi:hypothetical protein
VLIPNGTAVVITHEIRLFEELLDAKSSQQLHDVTLEKVYKITLNGLHPRIYVLRKSAR